MTKPVELFSDMSPEQKIDHCERCIKEGLINLQAEHGPVDLADILDVWDYWTPYMIRRMRKLEKIVECAKEMGCRGSEEFSEPWLSLQRALDELDKKDAP